MANVIKPKRSNTAAKVPNTSELLSGELGVNMADRKVYINNGTSVVQVGAGLLSALGGVTITSPTNGQVLSYNGTNWVNSTGSGSGTVTSVAALTLGTTGTDLSSTVANGTTTPVITLQVPTASATNRGALSAADWTTFNGKQAALGFTPYNATNPSNYIALASAITGYTVGTNTALAATDTLLAGLGKIQGQINARGTGNGTVTSVGGTGSYGGLTLTGTVTTSGNLTLGGTPTGTWPISVSGASASCSGNAATATTATTCNGNYNTTNAQQNGSDGWWRSTGSAGWYSTTYAVGIYSVGAGLVQTYNSSSFQANGALYATGNVTAYYSDERLKTNLGNVKNALDSVCKLNGFRYINNEVAKSVGYENEEVQLGVSAQEVEALFPEIVSIAPFDMLHNEETGAISSKSGEEYKTVDYARLVPVLIEAIKELKAEVNELKNIIVSNNDV
jgi:hypothetical protein